MVGEHKLNALPTYGIQKSDILAAGQPKNMVNSLLAKKKGDHLGDIN
jgi:hypothetical protein